MGGDRHTPERKRTESQEEAGGGFCRKGVCSGMCRAVGEVPGARTLNHLGGSRKYSLGSALGGVRRAGPVEVLGCGGQQ